MISDEDLAHVERDALDRYWKAVELADGCRRVWEEAGCPLTVV